MALNVSYLDQHHLCADLEWQRLWRDHIFQGTFDTFRWVLAPFLVTTRSILGLEVPWLALDRFQASAVRAVDIISPRIPSYAEPCESDAIVY